MAYNLYVSPDTIWVLPNVDDSIHSAADGIPSSFAFTTPAGEPNLAEILNNHSSHGIYIDRLSQSFYAIDSTTGEALFDDYLVNLFKLDRRALNMITPALLSQLPYIIQERASSSSPPTYRFPLPSSNCAVTPIEGILGCISLIRGLYLLYVTSSKPTASLAGHQVHAVTNTGVLAISPLKAHRDLNASPSLMKEENMTLQAVMAQLDRFTHCGDATSTAASTSNTATSTTSITSTEALTSSLSSLVSSNSSTRATAPTLCFSRSIDLSLSMQKLVDFAYIAANAALPSRQTTGSGKRGKNTSKKEIQIPESEVSEKRAILRPDGTLSPESYNSLSISGLSFPSLCSDMLCRSNEMAIPTRAHAAIFIQAFASSFYKLLAAKWPEYVHAVGWEKSKFLEAVRVSESIRAWHIEENRRKMQELEKLQDPEKSKVPETKKSAQTACPVLTPEHQSYLLPPLSPRPPLPTSRCFSLASAFIILPILGGITSHTVAFTIEKKTYLFVMSAVSRHHRHRLGPRLYTRGVDSLGQCATVEVETVLEKWEIIQENDLSEVEDVSEDDEYSGEEGSQGTLRSRKTDSGKLSQSLLSSSKSHENSRKSARLCSLASYLSLRGSAPVEFYQPPVFSLIRPSQLVFPDPKQLRNKSAPFWYFSGLVKSFFPPEKVQQIGKSYIAIPKPSTDSTTPRNWENSVGECVTSGSDLLRTQTERLKAWQQLPPMSEKTTSPISRSVSELVDTIIPLPLQHPEFLFPENSEPLIRAVSLLCPSRTGEDELGARLAYVVQEHNRQIKQNIIMAAGNIYPKPNFPSGLDSFPDPAPSLVLTQIPFGHGQTDKVGPIFDHMVARSGIFYADFSYEGNSQVCIPENQSSSALSELLTQIPIPASVHEDYTTLSSYYSPFSSGNTIFGKIAVLSRQSTIVRFNCLDSIDRCTQAQSLTHALASTLALKYKVNISNNNDMISKMTMQDDGMDTRVLVAKEIMQRTRILHLLETSKIMNGIPATSSTVSTSASDSYIGAITALQYLSLHSIYKVNNNLAKIITGTTCLSPWTPGKFRKILSERSLEAKNPDVETSLKSVNILPALLPPMSNKTGVNHVSNNNTCAPLPTLPMPLLIFVSLLSFLCKPISFLVYLPYFLISLFPIDTRNLLFRRYIDFSQAGTMLDQLVTFSTFYKPVRQILAFNGLEIVREDSEKDSNSEKGKVSGPPRFLLQYLPDSPLHQGISWYIVVILIVITCVFVSLFTIYAIPYVPIPDYYSDLFSNIPEKTLFSGNHEISQLSPPSLPSLLSLSTYTSLTSVSSAFIAWLFTSVFIPTPSTPLAVQQCLQTKLVDYENKLIGNVMRYSQENHISFSPEFTNSDLGENISPRHGFSREEVQTIVDTRIFGDGRAVMTYSTTIVLPVDTTMPNVMKSVVLPPILYRSFDMISDVQKYSNLLQYANMYGKVNYIILDIVAIVGKGCGLEHIMHVNDGVQTPRTQESKKNDELENMSDMNADEETTKIISKNDTLSGNMITILPVPQTYTLDILHYSSTTLALLALTLVLITTQVWVYILGSRFINRPIIPARLLSAPFDFAPPLYR